MATLVYQVWGTTQYGKEIIVGEYFVEDHNWKTDCYSLRIRQMQEFNRKAFQNQTGSRMTWNLVFEEPVYYRIAERDCDLMESSRAERFKNEREADKEFDRIYSNAEGPVSITRMTKEEYKEFKPSSYDRAADMMGY